MASLGWEAASVARAAACWETAATVAEQEVPGPAAARLAAPAVTAELDSAVEARVAEKAECWGKAAEERAG